MAVTYRLSATAAGYQLKRALLTLGHRPSYPVLFRRTVGHGRFCRPPQAAAPEVRSRFEVSRRYHMGFVSRVLPGYTCPGGERCSRLPRSLPEPAANRKI
jgi:hypothetical protein